MSLSIQRVPSASSSSSSYSSTIPSTYDVFLSFRGKDTRNGFTDHLHHALKQRGIAVFRDDKKLRQGKDISQALSTAIKESQYAVVIISKNFAFSKWCLRELTQIVECMREGRLKVLPVFYHVDPSDVRKQKGTFEKAFDKHREYFKINGRQKKSHRTEMKEVADRTANPSYVRRQKRSFEEASNEDRDNPEVNRRQMKSRRTDLKEVVDCAVDPSVARNQEMHFAEASASHAGNPDSDGDPVKSWRDALKEVGNLCGWHVNKSSEATVVQKIATEIFCGLRLDLSEIFGNLVGVDSKVKELESLLCLEKDDVRYIGIHGMGGVGKTTLAKVLYGTICDRFEDHCFIYGCNNNQSRNVAELQQEIIEEILKEHNTKVRNDYEGTKLLVPRLRNKKVLIIFDDINKEQLEALAGTPHWFGKGSRIVITSRDCQFWKSLVSHNNAYEVKLLDHKDALQLFCWNAFKRLEIEKNFMELSNKIIGYAGGLPLAIKVIGSSLVGKGMEVWNYICDYLEANPNAEVLDKLEISYNGLDDLSKELFLDIACFYNGMDVESIILIWKSLHRHPKICIDILKDKSLLEVSGFQNFQMHDLLHKMGQRIVYRENSKEPGKRSRLHRFNDIVHVLKSKSGTDAVKGVVIKFPSEKQERLSFEGFSNLPSLEILVAKPKYDWSGDWVLKKGNAWFGNRSKLMLSDELHLLEWWGYPLLSLRRKFQLKNLIVLKMPFSHIKQLWHGWKSFDKLTCIDVRRSKDLIRTPDFSGAPNLEKIDFSDCTNLQKVHPSIGNLKQLQYLSFACCSSLKELPKEVIWESLKSLHVSGCLRLKKFPNLSRVPNVEEIDLSDCESLKKVHASIGNLKKLQYLSFAYCTSLKELPKEVIWESLKSLHVSGCLRLRKFPNLSRVPNVEEIDLSGCESLRKVHSSIGNLKQLVYLDLFSCKSLKKLPKEINWDSLKTLCLSKCFKLKKLPDLSRMPNIQNIEIFREKWSWKFNPYINAFNPPNRFCRDGKPYVQFWNPSNPSIKSSKRRPHLVLEDCKSLEKLPKEFIWESLDTLCLLRCLTLEKLPDLSGIPNVKKIVISDCGSLRKVHRSIWNLKRLEDLELSYCESLKKLPKIGLRCRSGPEKFTKVMSNVTSLWRLDLSGLGIKMLPSSSQSSLSPRKLAAGGLKRTKEIQPPQDMLHGRNGFYSDNDSNLPCFFVPNCLVNLSFLTKLYLQDLNLSDESFPRDFSIPSLISLDISRNRFTKIPEFLSQLPKLKEVYLSHCKCIQSEVFPVFSGSLQWKSNLFADPDSDSLNYLYLDENEFVTLTDSFCLLSNLSVLSLKRCGRLKELPKLPLNLKFLHVKESPLLEMIYDQTDTETSWEHSDACVSFWFSAATINGYDGTPYKIIRLHPPCPMNKDVGLSIRAGVSWGPTIRFEIPEWFVQRSTGSLGKFQNRVDEDLENWLGYALFVVYEVHEHGFPEFVCRFHLDGNAREQPFVLHVPQTCSVGTNGFWVFMWDEIFSERSPKIFCCLDDVMETVRPLHLEQRKWRVGIKECGFSITSNSSNAEIKECGARVIHKSNVLEFFDVLSRISPHGLELKKLKDFSFWLDVGCHS